MLALAGREAGEAHCGFPEGARPRRHEAGGAAVGVAGAVMQGQGGRGVVVVAGAGGGKLLERGAGEERGGQAGMGGLGGQAPGGFPGCLLGEQCGWRAVPEDDRRRRATLEVTLAR